MDDIEPVGEHPKGELSRMLEDAIRLWKTEQSAIDRDIYPKKQKVGSVE